MKINKKLSNSQTLLEEIKSLTGFTLVELVIVLVILAVLIAIAMPTFMGARKKAYITEPLSAMSEVRALAWGYRLQYGNETSAHWSDGFGGFGPLDLSDYEAIGFGNESWPPTSNFGCLLFVFGLNEPSNTTGVNRPGYCDIEHGGCFAILAWPKAETPASNAGAPLIWSVMNYTSDITMTYIYY